MATIPVYRQQVIPNGTGVQPRLSRTDSGQGVREIGHSLETVAAGLDRRDDALRRKEEEDGRAWSAFAVTNDDVEWDDYLERKKAEVSPGASGFAGGVLKDFDATTFESLQRAPTEAAKRFYAQSRAVLRTRLFDKALRFEAAEGMRWRDQQWDRSIENVASLAARDPDAAKEAASKLSAILADSPYKAQADGKREKLLSTMSKAGALGMVERNPQAALDLLNKRIGVGKPGEATGDAFIDGLDAQTLVTLQNRASSYVAQAQNKIKAETDKREREAKDAIDELRTFTLSGAMPSASYSMEVMGKVRGTAYEGAATEMLSLATKGAAFGSMTLNQQREQLRAMEAQASSAGTDPETAKVLQQARSINDKQRQDYEENPWAAATRYARVPAVSAQDVGSPGLAAQVVAARLTQINDVEQYSGRPASPLQPEEAEQFATFLSGLAPEPKANELASVGTQLSLGRVNTLASQLDKKDRPLALALKLGSGKTTGDRSTAALLLRGQQALADKTVKRDDAVLSGWRAEISNMVRGTMGDPRAEQDIIDASYYVRAALDVKSSVLPGFVNFDKTNEEAVTLVIGQPIERQGVKTLLPRAMTEDQFDERLRTYTPDKLKSVAPDGQVYLRGAPISLDALSSGITGYGLRRDGQGRYIPVSNNAFVTIDKEGTRPLYLSVK